jgi:hypothetical protein
VTATYTFRATYQGERVEVLQSLPGAQWAIRHHGVPVSVSTQSLSDFRSERDPEPEQHRAAATRIPSRSGNRDADYWQATCSCGWRSSGMHPNRTVEGHRLAERDANDHMRARAAAVTR